MNQTELRGQNVLVMGLGLHGGGVETARYLSRRGARVTCTDLRSEAELQPSISALKGLDIRYVLGHHSAEDFDAADAIFIIGQNPGTNHPRMFNTLVEAKLIRD